MITFPLLLLAFFLDICSVLAAPASIWHVNIFRGPAPPPEEGPPLSAGALRDPSKLKYEIVGIVGAYLLWTILTIALILLVGLRLRQKIQSSNVSLSMEMMKPPVQVTARELEAAQGPKSPGKMASIRSWSRGHKPRQSNTSSSTVDERILEQDKAKNLDEMAKLYAAVMAHDEEKSQKARSSGMPSPVTPKTPKSPMYPPEFHHLRDPDPLPQPLSHPLAPTPVDGAFPETMSTSRASSGKTRTSPLPFAGANPDRTDSTNSTNSTRMRPSRISVRGLHISQPIGSADLRDSAMYGDQVPLSPRLYNPGPAPPTPGNPVATSREADKKGPPLALSLRNTITNNSTNSLPFRQIYTETLKSAPATKTTFLDRRTSSLNPGPRTGAPHTPYSPYMPFTPITPITPRRLMTKEDMKKNRKKEGMKVLSEDDMVMSDEDMWGEVR